MINKNPFVSIIIPVFNGGKILKECISMALKQDYKNKEIIVVDDFSNMETKNILSKINKIKLIENEKNLGSAASLNKGIKKAKGEYIVTLLQDCIPYSTSWLRELVNLAKEKEIVAIASRVKNDNKTWDSQDEIIKSITKNKKGFYSPSLDEKGCLYKKRYLIRVGLFDDKNFKFAGEDVDMYYKLSEKGKVLNNIKQYVIHKHFFTLEKLIWTKSIYGYSTGQLFKKYGKKLENWFNGVILMNIFPLWGILKGFKTKSKIKDKLKIILICVKLNWFYTKNFIKGYFVI
jgi:GT2 family glycosyltransferase